MIKDLFNVTTIDSTIWQYNSNAGLTNNPVYVNSGMLWLYPNSAGYSGVYFRTKNPYKYSVLKKYFCAEFDIQVAGVFQQGGASTLPYFGFVSGSATRDTGYYYSSMANNLVFEIANYSTIRLGCRNDRLNTTNYASCTGLNLQNMTHIKIVIIDNNIKLYINGSTTANIDFTVSDATFANLTDDARFELYVGNYQGFQYMVVDNIILDTIKRSHLIKKDDILKTTDGTTITTLAHTIPTTISDYNLGFSDMKLIKPSTFNVLFQETGNKFKLLCTKMINN
jgi:hypothetical protein